MITIRKMIIGGKIFSRQFYILSCLTIIFSATPFNVLSDNLVYFKEFFNSTLNPTKACINIFDNKNNTLFSSCINDGEMIDPPSELLSHTTSSKNKYHLFVFPLKIELKDNLTAVISYFNKDNELVKVNHQPINSNNIINLEYPNDKNEQINKIFTKDKLLNEELFSSYQNYKKTLSVYFQRNLLKNKFKEMRNLSEAKENEDLNTYSLNTLIEKNKKLKELEPNSQANFNKRSQLANILRNLIERKY